MKVFIYVFKTVDQINIGILSFQVFPAIVLRNLYWVPSNFFIWSLVHTQVSHPYVKDGVTRVRYICPFCLSEMCRFFQTLWYNWEKLAEALWILKLISSSMFELPVSWPPKYLNFLTTLRSYPSTVTLGSGAFGLDAVLWKITSVFFNAIVRPNKLKTW